MAQAKEESSLRSRTNSQYRHDSSAPERSLKTLLILIRRNLSSSCCERERTRSLALKLLVCGLARRAKKTCGFPLLPSTSRGFLWLLLLLLLEVALKHSASLRLRARDHVT